MNSSQKWLHRGALALYQRQTADEQSNCSTKYHNGQGFTAVDAPFLSSLAEQLLKGRSLSQKQNDYARKCMQKYAAQLAKIANGKQ